MSVVVDNVAEAAQVFVDDAIDDALQQVGVT
jgi:hypothetical protein